MTEREQDPRGGEQSGVRCWRISTFMHVTNNKKKLESWDAEQIRLSITRTKN